MRRIAVLLVVVGALVWSSGATAAPCADRCHVHLKATTTSQHWISPERFPASAVIYASVRSGGQRLGLAGFSRCALDYAGMGSAVRITTCTDPRLHVSYVAFAGQRRLVIDYWTQDP